MTRVGALLIDMLPAGLIVVPILGCQPADLLGLPLMTITFEQSVPYILMAMLTMLHSTVTELFLGRSLGKIVLGAKLLAADGGRPGRGRLLLRNVMKCLVVLIPPLAVIALANPSLQGLEDLAGGTTVVWSRGRGSDAASNDR